MCNTSLDDWIFKPATYISQQFGTVVSAVEREAGVS